MSGQKAQIERMMRGEPYLNEHDAARIQYKAAVTREILAKTPSNEGRVIYADFKTRRIISILENVTEAPKKRTRRAKSNDAA